MALPSGTYIITSKVQNSPVGRDLSEDKSLNPKRVIILPQGIEDPRWELTALPDGNHTMRIRGGYATEINKLLFAVLVEVPEPAIWKIEPQFHLGRDTYTITRPLSPEGWVASGDIEPGTQISVRPLVVMPSIPPQFPPNELFVISRID